MPTYKFTSPYPLVFGDLHAGVNAEVEDKKFAEGSAIILHDGDIVTTKEAIEHAFLIEVKEKAVKAESAKIDVTSEADVTPIPKPSKK